MQCVLPVCLRRTNNAGGLTNRGRTRGTASCGPGRRLSYCPSAMAANCALHPRLSLPLFVLFVLLPFPPLRRPQITFPALPPLRFCGEEPLRKPDSRHAGSRLCLFASPYVCPSPHPPSTRRMRSHFIFSSASPHRWTLSVVRMYPVTPLSHTTRDFPRLFAAIVIAAITTARSMSWRPLGK